MPVLRAVVFYGYCTYSLSNNVSFRIFRTFLQQTNHNRTILRNGSQPSIKGPDAWFIGTVRIDPLFPAHTPARASSAYVTFEPGARTAWHTHPLGQALVITAGVGRVQVQGGPIQEVRPSDTVWFPPYVKHWHGAAPGVAMTHISVAEEEDGNNVEWLEKVTEEQYTGN